MHEINDRSRDIGPFVPGPDDDMIICRCEEVTKGEIRKAVHDGMFTLTEIRRYLRTGMGLCQGQTCAKLVKGIVARELNVSPAELEPACRPRSNRKDHSGTSEIHHDVPLPETHNRLLPPETVPSTPPGKNVQPETSE